ncbi:MAG: imidazole glycerol phosphate synthase subunit HisF [Candidatus Omnitrophota bacterium]
MNSIRIIPRLDIKGPNLVKGVQLEGLRVLGKPEDFTYQYYKDGADELIYIDVVASLYGRNNLLEIVKRTAERIFIPLTVGGGIRTVDDVRNVLRAGADKVAINTAAVNNPRLIAMCAKVFGSQCIVVSIEAKRKDKMKYEAYTDNGRERTNVDVFDWAKKAHELGAGEILVTSIDRDGTQKGYDTELIRKISESLPIPVIACGGAGSPEHFYEAVKNGKVDAVSAATVFHYSRLQNIVKEEKFAEEGNIEYLKYRGGLDIRKNEAGRSLDIGTVKSYLDKKGIPVRMVYRHDERVSAR